MRSSGSQNEPAPTTTRRGLSALAQHRSARPVEPTPTEATSRPASTTRYSVRHAPSPSTTTADTSPSPTPSAPTLPNNDAPTSSPYSTHFTSTSASASA